MANGNQTKIDALAAEVSRRAEVRDAEFADLREIIAGLAARLGNTEAAVAKQKDPPGLLAIWGPVLSTAVILAGLVVFVIEQSNTPLKQQAELNERETDRRYTELNTQVRRMKEKQETNSETIAGLDRALGALNQQVQAMDNNGLRGAKR